MKQRKESVLRINVVVRTKDTVCFNLCMFNLPEDADTLKCANAHGSMSWAEFDQFLSITGAEDISTNVEMYERAIER